MQSSKDDPVQHILLLQVTFFANSLYETLKQVRAGAADMDPLCQSLERIIKDLRISIADNMSAEKSGSTANNVVIWPQDQYSFVTPFKGAEIRTQINLLQRLCSLVDDSLSASLQDLVDKLEEISDKAGHIVSGEMKRIKTKKDEAMESLRETVLHHGKIVLDYSFCMFDEIPEATFNSFENALNGVAGDSIQAEPEEGRHFLTTLKLLCNALLFSIEKLCSNISSKDEEHALLMQLKKATEAMIAEIDSPDQQESARKRARHSSGSDSRRRQSYDSDKRRRQSYDSATSMTMFGNYDDHQSPNGITSTTGGKIMSFAESYRGLDARSWTELLYNDDDFFPNMTNPKRRRAFACTVFGLQTDSPVHPLDEAISSQIYILSYCPWLAETFDKHAAQKWLTWIDTESDNGSTNASTNESTNSANGGIDALTPFFDDDKNVHHWLYDNFGDSGKLSVVMFDIMAEGHHLYLAAANSFLYACSEDGTNQRTLSYLGKRLAAIANKVSKIFQDLLDDLEDDLPSSTESKETVLPKENFIKKNRKEILKNITDDLSDDRCRLKCISGDVGVGPVSLKSRTIMEIVTRDFIGCQYRPFWEKLDDITSEDDAVAFKNTYTTTTNTLKKIGLDPKAFSVQILQIEAWRKKHSPGREVSNYVRKCAWELVKLNRSALPVLKAESVPASTFPCINILLHIARSEVPDDISTSGAASLAATLASGLPYPDSTPQSPSSGLFSGTTGTQNDPNDVSTKDLLESADGEEYWYDLRKEKETIHSRAEKKNKQRKKKWLKRTWGSLKIISSLDYFIEPGEKIDKRQMSFAASYMEINPGFSVPFMTSTSIYCFVLWSSGESRKVMAVAEAAGEDDYWERMAIGVPVVFKQNSSGRIVNKSKTICCISWMRCSPYDWAMTQYLKETSERRNLVKNALELD